MSNAQRPGLYYPYLHFPDNWLKVAALYWPRMARIVPAGLHLKDSETVQILSDELKFTVNVEPGVAADELTLALMDVLEEHPDQLRARYAVAHQPSFVSNWCRPTWPDPQRLGAGWRLNNPSELEAAATVVALHSDKAGIELWQDLADAGLAVRNGDWWGLHPELAWLYMCTLADKLAHQNHLIPTTDQYAAHSDSLIWTDASFGAALRGLDPQAAATQTGVRTEEAALLALSFVIPADIDSVPAQKIAKIRRQYASEFDAFHSEISDFADFLGTELAEVADPAVLSAYLENEAKRRFETPLTSVRRAMRAAGLDTAFTAVTAKFELPTSAAVLGGLLSDHPVVAGGGLVALAGATLVRNFRQNRNRVDPSAASYLWRVDQTLSPVGLLARLARKGK